MKEKNLTMIFEYISLQKPFIVCPNDHDVLEEISTRSGLGKVLDNKDEVAEFLNKSKVYDGIVPDIEKMNQFGVNRQVESLGELINN